MTRLLVALGMYVVVNALIVVYFVLCDFLASLF
jgi:hypothetical protein